MNFDEKTTDHTEPSATNAKRVANRNDHDADQFGDWLINELTELELRFENFVTKKSNCRYFSR